jgi:hypothetical protein
VASGTLVTELRPVGLGPLPGAGRGRAVMEMPSATEKALVREVEQATRALERAEEAHTRAREAADDAAARVKDARKRLRAARSALERKR